MNIHSDENGVHLRLTRVEKDHLRALPTGLSPRTGDRREALKQMVAQACPSPKEAAQHPIGWFDSTLSADHWFSLNDVEPERAAMLLCQYAPNSETLEQAQAVQVAAAIRTRVADLTATPITPAADEALAGELVPLLAALGASAQITCVATRPCFAQRPRRVGSLRPVLPVVSLAPDPALLAAWCAAMPPAGAARGVGARAAPELERRRRSSYG